MTHQPTDRLSFNGKFLTDGGIDARLTVYKAVTEWDIDAIEIMGDFREPRRLADRATSED
jgi:hypothetical protein